MKPNSKIQYVNKISDHCKKVLEEIPKGVFEQLTKLTRMTEERNKIKIDEMYLI